MSIDYIKSHFDIIDIAHNACGGLVKTGANCYKAKSNPLRVEKTSSLYFYADTQSYYDFGSGIGGDIVEFLAQLEDTSTKEIVKKYSYDDGNIAPQKPTHKEYVKCVDEPKNDSDTINTLALEKEFNAFEVLTFNNPKHKAELLQTFPFWLYKEAEKADLNLFKDLARYDAKNQTLACKWCDTYPIDDICSYRLIAYKRRRYLKGKWVNAKGTKPNNTPFIRIFDNDSPVLVVEGAHDMLAGVLLGLNFIALPFSGFKAFEAINKQINSDMSIICFVEDLAAFNAMETLSKSIIANKVKLMTFVKNENEKIDLSDYLFTKNSIDEVKCGLYGFNQKRHN